MNVQSNLVQSNLRRKSKWLCNLNTIPTLNMLTINDDLLLWKPGTYFWLRMWKYPNCSSTSKCLRFLYLRSGVFTLNAIADLLSICRRYRLVLSVTWTTQISPFSPSFWCYLCANDGEKRILAFWCSATCVGGWCIGSNGSGRALYFLLGFQYNAVIQIMIFSIINNRLQFITNVS